MNFQRIAESVSIGKQMAADVLFYIRKRGKDLPDTEYDEFIDAIISGLKPIRETAATKLGVPKEDYKDAKAAVDNLVAAAWSVEDSLGNLERTDDLDLDLRSDVLATMTDVIRSAELIKTAVEKGKL